MIPRCFLHKNYKNIVSRVCMCLHVCVCVCVCGGRAEHEWAVEDGSGYDSWGEKEENVKGC